MTAAAEVARLRISQTLPAFFPRHVVNGPEILYHSGCRSPIEE
jgi:hypothetical protein